MNKLLKKFRFSEREIIDLAKAWIVISVAFAIVLSNRDIFSIGFLVNFLISGITVGFGFLLHELAHKKLAQKYGCAAEFFAFNNILILALVLSYVFRFIFAAPGAVFISGNVNIERNGRISAAGPITNLILAFVFLLFFVILNSIGLYNFETFVGRIIAFGFFINSWLALFNMIPFWNFDGKKIFLWNKTVYLVIVAVGVMFSFFISPSIFPFSF